MTHSQPWSHCCACCYRCRHCRCHHRRHHRHRHPHRHLHHHHRCRRRCRRNHCQPYRQGVARGGAYQRLQQPLRTPPRKQPLSRATPCQSQAGPRPTSQYNGRRPLGPRERHHAERTKTTASSQKGWARTTSLSGARVDVCHRLRPSPPILRSRRPYKRWLAGRAAATVSHPVRSPSPRPARDRRSKGWHRAACAGPAPPQKQLRRKGSAAFSVHGRPVENNSASAQAARLKRRPPRASHVGAAPKVSR